MRLEIHSSHLQLLIFLFICNVLMPVFLFTALSNLTPIPTTTFKVLFYTSQFCALCAMILWIYCIRYFYKYDKYSKGFLVLLLFPGLVSAFYFYIVIWKQKRELVNTMKEEPVLGRTIHLESDYDEENNEKTL